MTRESGDTTRTEAIVSGQLDQLPEREAELVRYALVLTATPSAVCSIDIERLRAAGLDDRGIVDANQVTSYFNYVNRIADGLGVELEESWPEWVRETSVYSLEGDVRIPLVAGSALPTLDLAQSREMDRLMIEEIGVPLERMMENAGRAVAIVARARLGGSVGSCRIAVYAGRGGNGGGALVAARHLANAGAQVQIVTATDAERLAPTTKSQWDIARAMGIPSEVGPARPTSIDLILDGIHGYSLKGEPRRETAQLIETFGTTPIVSVDVPSGLEVASGSLRNTHARAAATVALAAPKHGTLSHANREAVGSVYVADISVPAVVFDRLGATVEGRVFDRGGVVRLDPGAAGRR